MFRHAPCAYFLVVAALLFGSFSCERSYPPEPEVENKLSIPVDPATYTFHIDPDSVAIESFPQLFADRDTLNNFRLYLNVFKHEIFPDSSSISSVSREFIIMPGDSFEIEISNCRVGKPWIYVTEDTNVVLVWRDSIATSDTTLTIGFLFKTIGAGKGSIGFSETVPNEVGSFLGTDVGFIVSYTAGIIENLWVELDTIVWEYEIAEWNTLELKLQGSTNAYRLKIQTHGDGLLSAPEIPIGTDSTFSIKEQIAFSHCGSSFLTCSTRLGVYGTVGIPPIIRLKNPKAE